MTASAFDVAGRLSEGERALAVLEDYVAACQVLGLPAAASLAELYRAESGLDLAALAADAHSLDAAAVAAREALRLQGNGYRDLTAQWSGVGGDTAGDFMRTLTVAAEDVVAHLRRSAQALTTLRDELWRAVDNKVDVVLRADAQVSGHRNEWSAAARAVLGGAGDVAAASEMIDLQVKPFVLRVVHGEVVPLLQDASEAVAAAYDSAIAAATPGVVYFGFPGQVMAPPLSTPALSGLRDYPPAAVPALGAAVPALGAAAGWSVPPAAPGGMPAMTGEPVSLPPATMAGAPETAPEPAPGPSATAIPAGAAGTPGDAGFGSGVGNLGQQLVDAIGGALGSMAGFGSGATGLGGLDDLGNGLADGPGLAADNVDAEPDEKDETDDDDEADEGAGEPDPEGDDTEGEPDEVTDAAETSRQPVDAGQAVSPPVPPQTVPDEAPIAPPIEPVAERSNPTTRTPCEIAADELPNVGE